MVSGESPSHAIRNIDDAVTNALRISAEQFPEVKVKYPMTEEFIALGDKREGPAKNFNLPMRKDMVDDILEGFQVDYKRTIK
jgi:hypothetical protein